MGPSLDLGRGFKVDFSHGRGPSELWEQMVTCGRCRENRCFIILPLKGAQDQEGNSLPSGQAPPRKPQAQSTQQSLPLRLPCWHSQGPLSLGEPSGGLDLACSDPCRATWKLLKVVVEMRKASLGAL